MNRQLHAPIGAFRATASSVGYLNVILGIGVVLACRSNTPEDVDASTR